MKVEEGLYRRKRVVRCWGAGAFAGLVLAATLFHSSRRVSWSNSENERLRALLSTGGSAALTAATPDGAASPAAVGHVYVVGCGHSGTSVLARTIAHLPGMMCIPMETYAYQKAKGDASVIQERLRAWDAKAATGSFTGWVEKTPKHVAHLKDILQLDPIARVVFVIRDGRDVAASLLSRGYTFERAVNRWVWDNAVALPFLDSPRVLTVRYEDFSNSSGVLDVLHAVGEFVGAPAPTPRLLLALQPTTRLLSGKHCWPYISEHRKEEDLARSFLLGLSSGPGAPRGGEEPNRLDHRDFRGWQVSQGWVPRTPAWPARLTQEQQECFARNQTLRQLLLRFGYAP